MSETMTRLSNAKIAPAWSRRPYVGTLPKDFHSPLSMAEATNRLAALLEGPEMVGVVDGNAAWVRLRSGPPLPATTLRLTIKDEEGGARLQCRFDASRWDGIDLWVYTGVATIGFFVAGAWFSGQMPPFLRGKVTGATPVAIAGLALVALAHTTFRRWRQAVRNRLFDQTIVALGIPIE